MNKKLLLVDGSSLLVTSFFGNIPREYFRAKTEEERQIVLAKVLKTSNGQYINGVFTMTKMILKLIDKQQPTHMAVAWDVSRNTFRRKMYSDYKGHREETRPELSSQFPLMQDILSTMNIPQFKYEEYEADDIIGTFTKKFEESIPTYIITKDQDALQLVSEHTRLWLLTSKAKGMYQELNINIKEFNIPDNVFEYTPSYVEYFYGLKPGQIIDKKAIEGDSSDNIPGVKGVGEKAVIPLLKELKTVEGIYDFIENVSEKEAKEFFKEIGIRSPLKNLLKEDPNEPMGKQAAFLSKKLATINISIPELNDISLYKLSLDINTKSMLEKFKELEFNSLIEKFEEEKETA